MSRLSVYPQNLPEQPTVFIVSQRTSSIQQADQIIMLDDGAVAGVGTHQQLLDSCPEYMQIFHSQKSTQDYELSTH